MNKTTSKIVQISDIVQWSEKGELELSPKYQRNNVWNDKAKAYLIDTIILISLSHVVTTHNFYIRMHLENAVF